MKKTNGEKLTEQLFKERFNIDCEPIPREHKKKTADYLLKTDDKVIAVCEVKDIEYQSPSAKNGWEIDEKDPDGFLSKNVKQESLIGEKIEQAFPQLENYHEPKVLVIVDFDDFYRPIYSLNAAVTGIGGTERIFITETLQGTKIYANSYRVAMGRIRKKRKKIDLYFWINALERTIASRFFPSNATGQRLQSFIWSRDKKIK